MHPEEISSGRRREGTRPPLRPQGRYRVATATALRTALDPGDHYGPQTPTPRGQTPTAPTPATPPTAAKTAKSNERPMGRLQMVSRRYEQKSLAKKSYT